MSSEDPSVPLLGFEEASARRAQFLASIPASLLSKRTSFPKRSHMRTLRLRPSCAASTAWSMSSMNTEEDLSLAEKAAQLAAG